MENGYEFTAWIDKYLPLLLEKSMSMLGAPIQEGFIKANWIGDKIVIEICPSVEFITFMEKTKHEKSGV